VASIVARASHPVRPERSDGSLPRSRSVPPGDDALSERIAILEERMKTMQAGLSASPRSS